jgi:hypothetical protein
MGLLDLPGVDFLCLEGVCLTVLSVACYFGWVD